VWLEEMVREAPLDLRRGNKKYNAIEALTLQSISYNIYLTVIFII
jgi:hypothetical protein